MYNIDLQGNIKNCTENFTAINEQNKHGDSVTSLIVLPPDVRTHKNKLHA